MSYENSSEQYWQQLHGSTSNEVDKPDGKPTEEFNEKCMLHIFIATVAE